MLVPEKGTFLTPPTTPCAIISDNKFLLPYHNETKEEKLPLHVKYKPPYAILTASILEVVHHAILKNKDITRLKFDPNKLEEFWRYFTYMLIHDSWGHLILNVVIQCLIAIPLERQQDSIRVGLLYLCGGLFGAMGAACTSPDYVIGASAGVYALLLSHISDLLLNFQSIGYKKTRCIAVGVIVTTDIMYNIIHFYNESPPLISWGAHIFGALAGLICGLMFYKSYKKIDKPLSNVLFYVGVGLSIAVLLILIGINVHVRKCTPVVSKAGSLTAVEQFSVGRKYLSHRGKPFVIDLSL